nr:PilN domain-containing protein [uncultured Enterobacter sp.]
MSYTVNLLPWRQQRQQRCRNVWCTVFSGTLLVMALITLMLRMNTQLEQRRLALTQQADSALINDFKRRATERQAAAARAQRDLAQAQRRIDTRGWRSTLVQLAEQMPEAAWLTQLRYQHGNLELEGISLSFDALAQLEHALKRLPGFSLGKTGATERDEQGRWQFHFQLTRGLASEPLP